MAKKKKEPAKPEAKKPEWGKPVAEPEKPRGAGTGPGGSAP